MAVLLAIVGTQALVASCNMRCSVHGHDDGSISLMEHCHMPQMAKHYDRREVEAPSTCGHSLCQSDLAATAKKYSSEADRFASATLDASLITSASSVLPPALTRNSWHDQQSSFAMPRIPSSALPLRI
jgi:hypothetical protein